LIRRFKAGADRKDARGIRLGAAHGTHCLRPSNADAEFERIRAQGYAFDREESVIGGICIGAAITLDSSSVTAALSVSTPLPRMTQERELEITRAVLDVARVAALELRNN
jgi:IclR family acetate operon transcriptional repressor